jgi:FlaA1/EpsC-like NDP-sugar epimerase
VTRYFLTLEEAATLVLAAASRTGNGSILVPQLGSPHKIVDLARYMLARQGEIPVVFTGLRPGEKMAEELTSSCEIVHPNAERELYRVDHATEPLVDLGDSIAALKRSALENDLVAALRIVRLMVPEFNPSEPLMALVESHKQRLVRA